MADPKLYAWIDGVSNQDIPKLLGVFKGKLGGVLYQKNYDMSLAPGRWIAYVGDEKAANTLITTVQKGGKIDAAIILDERNCKGGGLSGSYMTPQQYADAYNPLYDALHANGIPVSTMGLCGYNVPWSFLTYRGKLDDEYYKALYNDGTGKPLLHGSDYNAFNPGELRPKELERILSTYTERKWIFSPHPLNPQWWPLKWNNIPAWVLENWVYHLNAPFWVEQSKDPRLLGVAIWSLRFNWMEVDGKKVMQKYCNIFTDKNKLTVVGRQLKHALGV